ncbi:MAG: UbiD family decarboxylase [Deltaproteobacteria bacterium]|nr:UbiD family decarboxylase [Deltaproteobacteria bacterium]
MSDVMVPTGTSLQESQSLRAFLGKLAQQRDLATVRKEVDPRHEVAAVLKKGAEEEGPALFFERIKGRTMPLVGNVLAARRRLATALGASEADLLESYRQGIEKSLAPVRVERAMARQELADLFSLPVITAHERDAGPYITAGVVLASHPRSGKVNLSLHRICPINAREAAIYVGATSDLAEYCREAGDTPLPVAVAIGLHPAFYMIASTKFPAEMDELSLVGGLLGEGARLASDHRGLWIVPESAEIVLEGEIDFRRTVPEGPFGEYPGYYGGGTLQPRQSPVIRFTRLSCRPDPLYQTVITGPTTGYESTYFSCLSKEAMLYTLLRRINPAVRRVNVLLSRYIAVVQIQSGLGLVDGVRLMREAFSNLEYLKYVILVDEDVNLNDPMDVLWALSTRVDPGKNLHLFPQIKMEPLDPSTDGVCDKVGFDARRPAGVSGEGFLRTRIPGYETTRLQDYIGEKKER